ncbi:acyl-CoA dehydrogenase [Streptomyces sp. NBC_01498]|uniref:acyl-CoA dehydrogenase n=1 Tax=Streptomyces sp. NBC_01498 TaxID=2975870 RepID=UPI002E7B7E95|nr:acyl-CoA dehydrogenase [Streptomyces sp. NBC_01498]WTL29050.1 acyl-CoA dehydrogenase [Streptomyces sp. NBC_01498]
MWRRVTREVADDLAADAIARDRAGKPPYDEVARLREAGLPALLTPPAPPVRGAAETGPDADHDPAEAGHGPDIDPDHDPVGRRGHRGHDRQGGQGGADWRTATAVIREIAAADGSIGELVARHYVLSWSARLFGAPDATPHGHDPHPLTPGPLLGGSTDLPDPEGGPGPVLSPSGSGFLLNGRRSFAAGVTVADRLVVGATSSRTGESLIALVDPAHPGVLAATDGDRLGQRLTGAGTVDFDKVPVPAGRILGTLPGDEHAVPAFTALAPLALRLVLSHVALGIAEGALAEARDVSRAVRPALRAASPDAPGYAVRPSGDPYLLLAYGELATAAHTSAAVVERATDALERGLGTGRDIGMDERAEIAVLVAAAEAVTSRSAVDITTRVLELTQTPTVSDGGAALDRFWRNARALTAQSSPTHRLRDIGDHYLNGTHPPFGARF